jgi:hypothetical protein
VNVASKLALLGATLAVSACVAGPPPGPPMGIVGPGKDKTQAAFQQDQSICQQHAVSQTGYGLAPQNPADHPPASETPIVLSGAPANAAPPAPESAPANATPPIPDSAPANGPPPNASNGLANYEMPPGTEIPGEMSYLQCMAARGDNVQLIPVNGYYDGYGYPYPYPYAYPYYDYGIPIYGGLVAGWGWYGWGHGGWHGGYWGRGYWGRGYWGRGGWGHAGWGHGGWGHGGMGHGGGGGGHH